MADSAIAEAERILKEHVVPPLEPHQEKELDRIMAAAEAEMVRKKLRDTKKSDGTMTCSNNHMQSRKN
jgi:polysaccharide deacetylase 2 family uncharacterized protein YibQ